MRSALGASQPGVTLMSSSEKSGMPSESSCLAQHELVVKVCTRNRGTVSDPAACQHATPTQARTSSFGSLTSRMLEKKQASPGTEQLVVEACGAQVGSGTRDVGQSHAPAGWP